MVGLVCHRPCTHSGGLISVESPAISLVFIDSFTDILVVINSHTRPFLQLGFTFIYNEEYSLDKGWDKTARAAILFSRHQRCMTINHEVCHLASAHMSNVLVTFFIVGG